MKKLILTFSLLFFLQYSYANSQWLTMNSNCTKNLVDICFVNDSIGYVLSDSGVVLKTTDVGSNWYSITNLSGNFTSICHIGKDTIYVGGDHIYRSDNAGLTWQNIATLPYVINDLEFFNSNQGMYIKPFIGGCGFVSGIPLYQYEQYSAYFTSDGGMSWQLTLDDSLNPYVGDGLNLDSTSQLMILNDTTVVAFGCYPYFFNHQCAFVKQIQGRMSVDKGKTWFPFYLPTVTGCHTRVSMIDATSFFLFEDGGQNLSKADMQATWSFVASTPFLIEDMAFLNDMSGFALSMNSIYSSVDGGVNWNMDTVPNGILKKLYNNKDKEIFAIGKLGKILRKAGSAILSAPALAQTELEIKIFPNPVTNQLKVRSFGNENLELILFDISSRKLKEIHFKGNTNLDVSEFSSGVYLLEVKQNGLLVYKDKIIKN